MEGLNKAYSSINGQQRSNFKILVIEDDTAVLKMCSLLKDCGFSNHTHAKTGLEAIKLYALDKFDLVVLDVEVADIDGFMAGAAMKGMERYRDFYIPIIAVSPFDGLGKDTAKAGLDDFETNASSNLENKVVGLLSQLTTKRIN